MTQVKYFLSQALSLFTNLFYQPDWRNLLDVAIVAVFIYYILKLVIHTRVSAVFKGLGIILVLAWIANVLELFTLSWIIQQLINTGVLVLVIIFGPEIRRWLEQLGRTKFAKKVFVGSRRKQEKLSDRYVNEIVTAYTSLSRRRVGALIVLERQTPLDSVIDTGTRVDASISAPLIENVFEPNTPLHDGAMIIRGDRIVAAACILELSSDHSISRELGTRHRAAIGVTENSDAVSIIVSEETGTISMARDGRLTRYLDAKSLTILLSEFFASAPDPVRLFGGARGKEDAPNE